MLKGYCFQKIMGRGVGSRRDGRGEVGVVVGSGSSL